MNYIINEIWDKFLRIHLLKRHTWFKNILLFIKEEYKKPIKICPEKDNIFNMFKLLTPSQIRVFMLFQDPYPQLKKGKTITNGIGLAAPYETVSLKHLSEAIGILGRFDNTMNHLIKQGVFSVNKYLTVEAHKPLSHSESNKTIHGEPLRWDLFTKWVLYRLNQSFKNIVYIFFGSQAQELSHVIDNKNNLVIETSHPSNRGYKHGLLHSKFAQTTNEYLELTQNTKIQWKLHTM